MLSSITNASCDDCALRQCNFVLGVMMQKSKRLTNGKNEWYSINMELRLLLPRSLSLSLSSSGRSSHWDLRDIQEYSSPELVVNHSFFN